MSWFTIVRDMVFPKTAAGAQPPAIATVTAPFSNFAAQVDAAQTAAVANGAPTIAGTTGAIKQAASDAIGLLKTGVDVGIDDATIGVEALADAMFAKMLGPFGALVSPADHALAQNGAAILKGVIDGSLLKLQAKVGTPVVGTAAATLQLNPQS